MKTFERTNQPATLVMPVQLVGRLGQGSVVIDREGRPLLARADQVIRVGQLPLSAPNGHCPGDHMPAIGRTKRTAGQHGGSTEVDTNLDELTELRIVLPRKGFPSPSRSNTPAPTSPHR
jgi:hypothetical protein